MEEQRQQQMEQARRQQIEQARQQQLEQARQRQMEQARQRQMEQARQRQHSAAQQEQLWRQQRGLDSGRRAPIETSDGNAPSRADVVPSREEVRERWRNLAANAEALGQTARDVARDVVVDVEFGRDLTKELMFDTHRGPIGAFKERVDTYMDEQIQGMVQEYVNEQISQLPGIQELEQWQKDVTSDLAETFENVMSSSGPTMFDLAERSKSLKEGLKEMYQNQIDHVKSGFDQITGRED